MNNLPLTLARLSRAIYEPEKRIPAILAEEFEDAAYLPKLIRFFDNGGTQAGLFQLRPRHYAIAFRGTEFSGGSLIDIARNLGRAARWKGPGRAHSGYAKALRQIYGEALEMTREVASEFELWLCGHSMGGSLTIAVACRYYHDNLTYKLAGMMTFGAPKVVNREAWSTVPDSLEHKRFVFRADPAQWWPFFSWRLWQVPVKSPLRSLGIDHDVHDVDSYVKAMARL